ncbi:mannitol dehydrogenase family protein [Rhodobacteraceae bacterium 2376]|uniref:Mannitol dehydrogenase family protein n=1 Tax=Rhabdonatronobacter sediminivivens TaxID=2743469 RepID=A0A7Z0I202_9RHOB|nr:mannitol dehydrogenase family protein [Rhabdonatronobacter sediminivivens]NYS26084.1 mannitol dehydrogenase family protein [Rhabdonatronobacter sediminivivens]
MDELIPLSQAMLGEIPSSITVPNYDRRALRPGIVHIGLGNFHRAHQAWYTHRLMQMGLAQDWAIIGAGVRPGDTAMREKLLAQDCLSTLIELDPAGKSAEITGAMLDFLPVESDNATLIARMAQADIGIVSLTVTEGGYYLDPETGGLDAGHEDIRHDASRPSAPRTAFGAMVAALRLRRERGSGPFTSLCCDNLQGNGMILRQTVVGLARLSDPDLADWIDAECSFPNSMVDCIVPATGPREIALAHSFGIADAAPVTHETFRQWVIEDEFCAGRPDWDRVGAVFSSDVHVYEAMKIRILNGGHQVICGAGELLGLGTVAATMAHDRIRAMFRKIARDEIAPHVPAVPGGAALDYIGLIERRFANPEILDTTRRVAFDGSSRHAGFLLPSIRDALARGTPLEGLALASALWARYCLGVREDGSVIAANDPLWPSLQAAARAAQETPAAWLEQVSLYRDVKHAPRFADAFVHWYGLIASRGVNAAISGYLARQTA